MCPPDHSMGPRQADHVGLSLSEHHEDDTPHPDHSVFKLPSSSSTGPPPPPHFCTEPSSCAVQQELIQTLP